MSTLLFVYGSLKRGLRNHAWLRDQPFVAEARTLAAFALVCVDGAYPALVRGGARSIEGELYLVDAERLAELDVFEGDEYTRGPIELSDGQVAHAYIAVPETAARSRVILADRWDGA